MRALVQRVKKAKVTVKNNEKGSINEGLLVFLGIGKDDNKEDINYLVDKIINLRIFEDEDEKMNLSALNLKKEILVVSQFTLYGDCSQGRRPSFFEAASPEKAEKLYNLFVNEMDNSELNIETGEFKAMMDVELVNDGPVTLWLDTDEK
ncbi:MAG TPA: D-aminoacyl-tRNA deacylase [Halanaerobiales bacterium]|nr:D-aminoacyl-tRNA deacylase [Halanaerobiales bacterium]